MVAKGFYCAARMKEFTKIPEESDSTTTLELANSFHLGTFRHAMVELWLKAVNTDSTFPIKFEKDLEPRFKSFFHERRQRSLREELFHLGYVIEGDFSEAVKIFNTDCKIESLILLWGEKKTINKILVESFQPVVESSSFSVEHGIMLKGYIDCIFICETEDILVDWKSTVRGVGELSHNIQLKCYMDIWREAHAKDKQILGRIVSLTKSHEEYKHLPYFTCHEDVDTPTQYEIIAKLVDRIERAGDWCDSCHRNFASEPCLGRSNAELLRNNSNKLRQITFSPRYWIDIELPTSDFRFRTKKVLQYAPEEPYSITFQLPANLNKESFEGHRFIRCKGALQSKLGQRQFRVKRFSLIP